MAVQHKRKEAPTAQEEEYTQEEEALEGQEVTEDGEAQPERPTKKPKPADASKEAHIQQKKLKQERRLAKPHGEAIVLAKKLWEKLRRRDTTKAEKATIVDQILTAIEGQMMDVIFKHDASRIVQACIKDGNDAQRQRVCEELNGHYLQLAQSQYGRFLISKILQYCSAYRAAICKEFYGKVRKYIRHKEASAVIEELFARYANSPQRAALLEEFYGPEFALFKGTDAGRSLRTILEEEPGKRERVIKHLREAIASVMDKGTVGHSIVHRAILEYLQNANHKEIQEMVELVKEQIVEIIHTKDGARSAMALLLHASPKDRKVMLKVMKPFALKVAQEEYGHLVLLRVFDVVDDTVLVNKMITSELSKEVPTLSANKYGRRVLLYLLCGRVPQYFFPETLDLLREGDTVRAETSKKDPEVRALELLTAASPALLQAATENAPAMVREGMPSQVYREILLRTKGDKAAAFDALSALVALDCDAERHVAQDNVSSRVLKVLIANDTAETPTGIAQATWEGLKVDAVRHVELGAGFVILALLEHPVLGPEVRAALKAKAKILGAYADDGNKGAGILVEKLNETPSA